MDDLRDLMGEERDNYFKELAAAHFGKFNEACASHR